MPLICGAFENVMTLFSGIIRHRSLAKLLVGAPKEAPSCTLHPVSTGTVPAKFVLATPYTEAGTGHCKALRANSQGAAALFGSKASEKSLPYKEQGPGDALPWCPASKGLWLPLAAPTRPAASRATLRVIPA